MARAYDLAGEADSALAIYERYVMHPSLFRPYTDSFDLSPTYERLAAMYEQRGDTAKAIYYYGKLVELWKDADPELQPRVEAARRAIEALSSMIILGHSKRREHSSQQEEEGCSYACTNQQRGSRWVHLPGLGWRSSGKRPDEHGDRPACG
jgi:tetratricopeptide (TPR) repeat protein